ncbi:MAG: ABC transporter ATP-binding protein [Candidatus Shapirobacteria bacterium]|jgi:putative ABC transport system ATP-binding protein
MTTIAKQTSNKGKDVFENLVVAQGIRKSFDVGNQVVEVLKGIDLKINKGDFAIIFGPSGCGKSTLLHTLLGLEKPSEGKVIMEGKDYYGMGDDEIVTFRKNNIGIVFQQPIWIKSLNVMENVCVPNRLRGLTQEEAEEKAMISLRKVKLEGWHEYHPNSLSSGQQQRVSLARALTIDPLILVADEPTGNLDTVSGDELMELLRALNQDEGRTVVMVTHDLEYLRYATKLFHIIDGLLVEEIDEKGAKKLAGSLRNKKGKRGEETVRNSDYLKTSGKKYVS